MKVLVTGVNGQLGYDMVNELNKRGGYDVTGVDVGEMDISDEKDVRSFFETREFDAIVHCAAYTNVDSAEEDKDTCLRVNVDGTRYLAQLCREKDMTMIYISTDYIFDGSGDTPWIEDDEKAPVNTYGLSKYLGELAVIENIDKYFIVRISWAFGKNGKNFIATMLKKGRENSTVSVVNDQIGSPTYTYDLAVLLADMLATDKYGCYNATNEGYCSWYDLTKEAYRLMGIDCEVRPISTEEFGARAERPKNSRLSKKKLDENGFHRLPDWHDALKRFLE